MLAEEFLIFQTDNRLYVNLGKIRQKQEKTPLMTAEVFDLTCCTSSYVPKSTLLRKPEVQYGLVPKLSHHERQKHRLYKPEKQVAYNLGKGELVSHKLFLG